MRSFNENMGTDAAEPTVESHQDFDWDSVEAAFGEQPLTPQDSERLSVALRFVIDWLLSVDLKNPHALKSIGKRTIAMAWVVNPDRFGDASSLRSLATKLGFTAPNIAKLTAEFSRLAKIHNRYQVHNWRKDIPHGSNN